MALLYTWDGWWARPEQIAPPDTPKKWWCWLIQAGRGWGKTRTGAEWVRQRVRTSPYVSLVGATASDVMGVMIDGPSGIMSCCSRRERPVIQSQKTRLVWPNGAISRFFSAEEPDRLRGPQHSDVWCDEIAAWRYSETWDQVKFGLRLGADPRACITTTPRPTPLVREIIADPGTVVSRGTTRDNQHNLARTFMSSIVGKYEGTRLGRQELDGEVLDDNPGALWTRALLEQTRVRDYPPLQRIVVAVDPSGTGNPESDECGIVVAGIAENGHGYVLGDISQIAKPDVWAKAAVRAYTGHQADRLVGESNYGGDMVEAVIRAVDDSVAYRAVHASRGKMVRAEPVAALYEQGRVHHVGAFPKLEDEQCEYDGKGKSPNRFDALVWAITDLMLGETTTAMLDWLREQDAAKPAAPAVPGFKDVLGVNTLHGE